MGQKDYYQILDLEKNATTQQIKEAYRKQAFKYHPDRNEGNEEASEKMKAVNEAYAVLSNPQKRQEYDMLRHRFGSSAYSQFRRNYSDEDIFSGSDINRIFEEMTRSFGLRGFDEIFKEFYGSGYQTFEFKKPGFSARRYVFTGQPGREDQQKIQSMLGGNLGKLGKYVLKKIGGVEFPEEGTDITDNINLSPQKAQEGGRCEYFHRKKLKRLSVKVPAGVREGQRIRLAGMGEEGKGGGKPGDLYLKVHIRKPILQKIKDAITDFRK